MKKNILQEKFDGYQKIIKSNIEIIRELINQSKKLDEIINLTKNAPNKEKIIIIQKGLQDSIDELLDNTDKLFQEYKLLIKEYAASA